jgi:uncharacterized membrane protein YgcG
MELLLSQLFDHIEWVIGAVFVAFIAFNLWNARRALRAEGDRKARDEALFVSMFPDLQPHFHPKKLIEYVRARRASMPPKAGKTWKLPPGFGVHDADIRFDNGKEQVRLRDAAGSVLAMFLFEEHQEGGVIRFGKGKFTVNIREAAPRVRYWHPDREFKWSQPKGWTFVTRMADEPFSGSSSSSDSSSSGWSDSSRTAAGVAAGAAAGAAIAGAGGAFDGGGASQGWDGDRSSKTSY